MQVQKDMSMTELYRSMFNEMLDHINATASHTTKKRRDELDQLAGEIFDRHFVGKLLLFETFIAIGSLLAIALDQFGEESQQRRLQ
jgi:hypothetical protein